jgi:fucose 4-O-acetylase-like acetyltransferase
MASRYKKGFNFKPFCYLGKYSLEVFSFHILLVIVFKPFKEYSNQFYALAITENLNFYPWATFMLFFMLLPALFLAPLIKNNITSFKLKSRTAAG